MFESGDRTVAFHEPQHFRIVIFRRSESNHALADLVFFVSKKIPHRRKPGFVDHHVVVQQCQDGAARGLGRFIDRGGFSGSSDFQNLDLGRKSFCHRGDSKTGVVR